MGLRRGVRGPNPENPAGGRPPIGGGHSPSQRGFSTYDRWVAHEIEFDDPTVVRALDQFGEIIFGDGSVLVPRTLFRLGHSPMRSI